MSDDKSGCPPHSGHSRHIREVLRAARQERGLTLAAVGQEIGRTLDKPAPKPSTVSCWESFVRHPPIDVMAAWARAVGYRLVVEVERCESSRVPVMVRPRAADLARLADLLADEDLEALTSMAERIVKAQRRR